MHELTPNQFPLAHPLFAAACYGVLSASTLDHTHPGRVFVDDPTVPRASLICTRAGIGYYFLVGQPGAAPVADFLDSLHAAFHNDLLPAQKDALNNPEILLFFPPGADWQPALLERFADCRPIVIQKLRHILPTDTARWICALPQSIPDGLRLASYSMDLLAAHPEIGEEAALFYGSHEAFIRNSLGVCLLDGDKVASYCHAVFTGAGEAEISIATASEYRKRGLAEITATAFIRAALDRDLAPIWGCWPENVPSVALASKLGFVEQARQPVLLWVDAEEWNRAQA